MRIFAFAAVVNCITLALESTPAVAADSAPQPAPKLLRAGIEPTAEPFTFLDINGQPVGFSVDLLRAVARDQGFDLKIVALPWTEVIQSVSAGEIDVIANIGYLPERANLYDFSIPHATIEGAVFLRDDHPEIKSLDELRGLRIAVGEESIGHAFARRHGLQNGLVFVSSLQECLLRLEHGRVDAVLASRPIGLKIAKDMGLHHIHASRLKVPDMVYELHMAVPRGRTDLLYQLNLGIHHAHKSGLYDELYEKWLGPIHARQVRWRDLEPFWVPGILAIIALVFALWRQRHLLRRLTKQANALKMSEERLSLVIEGSQDAFWDWDLRTNRVVRSTRWAEMLGFDSGDITDNLDALKGWIHPDDAERVQTSRNQIVAHGHGKVEYRIRARDGSWRWMFDRGSVVERDETGEALRVTGVVTDITARKQIEAALIRSQRLLEQTQDISKTGGWEYDLRSGSLFWTQQMYRIHEIEDAGSPLSLEIAISYFVSASQAAFRRSAEAAVGTGASFDLELELLTAKKRGVWVRVSGRAERDGGRVVRIFGSYQDISGEKLANEERQKLQLKMLETQKLESLGVLAGGIAHDFNNLLTVILGNASLAREDAAAVNDALEQISTAGQRAADLCRQMLAYAGKSRFNVEALDLTSLVSDTVQLLKLSISKSASLEIVPNPTPLPIEADPSQIRQVIMNMVINASESFGGGNGRIRLVTTEKEITRPQLREARIGQDNQPGKYVGVEIEDNGCGMSPETMARIFDPFFTTKFTGRGLGLAAVVGVVRSHKGIIFVQSAPGLGTTFRIFFPRGNASLDKMQKAHDRAAEKVKAEGTILVVDDEPNVRRVASAILERHGYTVALAADGYEALALGLAHGGKFAAVLLDLMMPGLDGPGTLKELRAMNPHLPILLMSGFTEEDARRKLPSDGLVAFLPKPFTAEDLLRAIASLRARLP